MDECVCCCCYCYHCNYHPHHHCHCAVTTAVAPHSRRQLHQLQQRKRIAAAKRLPELPCGIQQQQQLPPLSSQSLSSTDDKMCGHRQMPHHMHHHPQRRHHSRLPESIPTGGEIAIEIDAATLTDDISYCSSGSIHSFALANDTSTSKDILVHCNGDNHHHNQQHHHPRGRSKPQINCEQSSRIDSNCSTTSAATTTEDSNGDVVVVQRKCKRLPPHKGRKFTRQDTLDGAADVEEDDDEEEAAARPCCDAKCCKFSLNESVKIKRKQFIDLSKNYYCSSCSKCSSCSGCHPELGDQHKSCSFSSSLSHMEDDDDGGGMDGDDEVCSHCDDKADESDGAEHSSEQHSTESFCSCNSTSRCYCSCSCDDSDTIRKDSSTATPATMSDVSTPVEEGHNGEGDGFSMAGKSSVSQSEYFSLSSDKPPSHSVGSSPASPPVSVMPSPPALPRKQCKHYSKHHRHKGDGNFDTVL